MTDDTREQLPQRAMRAFDEEASLAESGLAAFRARVQKFALPAVLAMAVSAGLVFGGLAPEGAESQALTAAPAAPAPVDAQRTADDVSRDGGRTPEATPEASAEATEAPAPEAQPANSGAAIEAKALTGFSASPNASPSASKSASASAAATTSGGRMYATETVNVRSEASASSDRIGSVDRGDAVTTTGRTSSGFTQVNVNSRTGWVSTEFLSRTAPTASSRPATSSSAPRSSSSAPAPAAAPGGGSSCAPLRGLQARTEAVHQALCAGFPAVSSYGGVRPDWDVEHPSGRAIDAMVSSTSTGDAVANWARANAGRYGITEVIWNQRIWTTQRASEGWRYMGDRGSATANHRDHVHISVR